MKRLYMCRPEMLNSHDCMYEIRKETPHFFRAYSMQDITLKSIVLNIYWWLITNGKYRVWCAYDGIKVIHTSYVIPKCYKFPFLKKGSYEIGPCYTDKDYRGKSIYPAVLSKIVVGGGTAYMIINDNNASSIRGVIKAGFVAEPGEIKCDRIKRYVYLKEKQL